MTDAQGWRDAAQIVKEEWHQAVDEFSLRPGSYSETLIARILERFAIRAALSAAPRWLPIEEAPRDGTTVFACNRRMGQRALAHFNADGRWEVVNGLTNWPAGKFFEPTHYMPLPSPPEGDTK